MAGKNGVIPKHVKKKFFSHPNIQHPLIQILEKIEDSRKPSYFFQYSLQMTCQARLSGLNLTR
jgi:hypothetical protein